MTVVPEITTATFDLWQTLLLDNLELGHARAKSRLVGTQQALAAAGKECDLERLSNAYSACHQQCQEIRGRHIDISFLEQVRLFVSNIEPGLIEFLDRDYPESMGEIARVYADAFLQHPPPAHKDALPALRGVKDLGLRIGLISNTGMTPGTTFRTYLENTGMLDYFDVLTFSDEVKLSKPGSAIFLLTLRSLKASPAETVHVGDHVQNDVTGAKECGMRTVWITGFSERPNPDDPRTKPDETVDGLGEVVSAIARLARVKFSTNQ